MRSALSMSALTFVLVLGGGAPALAAEDAVHIKYRQKVMAGVGADMGAISDILKNGLPYTAAIALHADRLGDSAALIPTAFSKNVSTGATDAKPEIWQKADEFERAIQALEDAADDLEEAADDEEPAAIAKAFKVLGKSCGGCHETFRKPKEESYKKQ